MKTYERYKESGIEWIGEIPEEWEKYRMANNGCFSKGKGVSKSQLSKEGFSVILYGDIYTKYDIYTEELERKISSDVAQNSIEIYNGDLLFTASGETIEEIGKGICYGGNEKAFAGGDVIIFRQSKWNSKYLSYLFNSYLFQEQKSKRSKGDIVVHVYSTQLRNIHFPIPPTRTEQTAIANYLDRKTTEIDQLITDKKRLVQLYKEEKTAIINQAVTKGINPDAPMKDGGIEWLGEVPEHWEVKRIKYVGGFINGYSFKSKDFKSSGIRVLKIANVQNMRIDWSDESFIDEEFYESKSGFRVLKNDLVFALTRPIISTGIKVALMDSKEKILLNQRNSIFRPNQDITKWMYFILLSTKFIQEFDSRIDKTGQQPNISSNDIGDINIPMPNAEEQTQIVQHIEKESKRINSKTSKAEKYITLLTEYRTALISEVVTGKVKVV